jgi:L-iditol 2-dehydrogenase
MKVARLSQFGRFDLREEPTPAPGAGQVLVEVRCVGLCGSDRHYLLEGGQVHGPEALGLVLGHEVAGVVAAIGPQVQGLTAGTPVAIDPALPCSRCRWCLQGQPNVCPHGRFLGYPPTDGALRQFLVHPAELVVPVSSGVHFEQIAMAEPLAIALYAMDCSAGAQASTAAVVGCGAIGLLLIQLLARQGVPAILGADRLMHKLSLARRLGASVALDTGSRNWLSQAREAAPHGFDVVFEAAGDVEASAQAVELAAPGGRVVLAGINPQETITYRANTARRRGLTILNLRRSNRTTHRAVQLIERGLIDTTGLVTHRFGLEHIDEAFATFMDYRDNAVKVCVEPNG